jgi:hypothetical protein
MDPRRSLPPLELWRGTRPSQAANCRPDWKCEGSGTVAAMAVAVMKPMPGIVSSLVLAAFWRCRANNYASIVLMPAWSSLTG